MEISSRVSQNNGELEKLYCLLSGLNVARKQPGTNSIQPDDKQLGLEGVVCFMKEKEMVLRTLYEY